jgi:hypothetical protein
MSDAMHDYLFLMHPLPPGSDRNPGDWGSYLARLRRTGRFGGGSSVGGGVCVSRSGVAPISMPLAGYIRVSADSIEDACALLEGNPVIEAGGTVEVRELPRD